MSDLNMSYEKMSDFVSFPLSGFFVVIKLENFDEILKYFLIKKMISDLNLSHEKNV